MTVSSHTETTPQAGIRSWISLDTWAVIAATAVVLFIVLNVGPHVPW